MWRLARALRTTDPDRNERPPTIGRFETAQPRGDFVRSTSTMALIAYHNSHEQFAPSRLLRCTKLAEQAGFQGFFSSDHFHPWSEAQGQSGFSWSWMGAALAS